MFEGRDHSAETALIAVEEEIEYNDS